MFVMDITAMIVDHISYDRIQGEYDSTIFANAGGRDETDAIRVSKCVQDWVFPDGDPKVTLPVP